MLTTAFLRIIIVNVLFCRLRSFFTMSEVSESNKYQKKILTIPNVLSFIRLCLIPVLVWLYFDEKYLITGIVLIISCLTDIIDGTIARKFNMISDLGKVLDPIADKATQLMVMILLTISFPLMIIPIVMTVIKETFMAISGWMVIKKCNIVLGAHWHGKAATVLLSIVMALHLVWHTIDPIVSAILIGLSTAMILLSLILYVKRNLGYLLGKNNKNAT